MNAPALLLELSQRGVSVQVRGDKLRLLPKGAAGDLLCDVARFKPQLIELLGAPNAFPASAPPTVAEESHQRLMALERALGVADCCRTVYRQTQRLKHHHPRLFRSMTPAERHDLAVQNALGALEAKTPHSPT